ncbi:type II toxin-antitoxin system HipA family toxin [Marinobacter sp.]|uniref:type II toxin-antitoxin system HipA family toxin n=1 Tax=Marinobacter sp. TaxID=50741 RepID=UPI00384E13EA
MGDAMGVRVQREPVGVLARERGEFIFNYDETADPGRFVSLTMPVRTKGYVLPHLHPIFEMHLPEGYLLAIIKKQFAKITATDDFGLLKLLAPGIRGRVHFDSAGAGAPHALHLEDLLHPHGEQLFEELVQRFALRSPLSGVQPKVLARVENKATLRLEDYIVKAWGPEYPELALNEYYCMMGCRFAGIPVPEFHLSDDEALFIMKRFDLTETGEALGFEDMCVLQGRQRDDKYTGSYEQIAKSIKLFASPDYKASSLQQFFKMMVLNNRLQNGDAHLKNFGMLYGDVTSIGLAPAYDVVSTTAYIKRDIAALTLLGSKKWWGRVHLIRFGTEVCELTRKQAGELYDECVDALGRLHDVLQNRLTSEKADAKRQVLEHLADLTCPEVLAGPESQ